MREQRQRLTERLLENLRLVIQALHATSSRQWMELELTTAQLRMLFTLATAQPATVGELAERLDISGPTASHLVDRLVQAGLVSRAEDPADRRRTLVRLTAAGDDLTRRLRQGNREALLPLLERLALEDLESLDRGLAALAQAAKDSGLASPELERGVRDTGTR
ncbi:MarR family transcriptional regulator [Thermomicrobiaceae bacterium CFH 74404]|uniref:MarR family transcriptional regulator n=1 Tax=Thermalbibacter longus TaxID=2951981 RepID=A0AA41WDH1_9BACT|nr:MarR family transcriptional regulator [Thermalbibacter longus]MCM8748063.1 MarR family transcriptional regulator [Thermalbibacter longus]